MVKNNFTEKEVEYCYSHTIPEIHLAGIFSAKEALIKTLGNQKSSMKDIEVLHEKGVPRIYFSKAKADFEVSISHTKKIASAVVLRK